MPRSISGNPLLILAVFAVLGAGCKGRTESRAPFKVTGAQPLSGAVAEKRVGQGFGEVQDSFVSLAVSPKDVRLFWKDKAGNILGSLGAARRAAAEMDDTMRFAMNAGMYTEDQGPLGLFIQEGKTLHGLNRDTGYGNFYLRPNGVFFVTKTGEAGVCRTQDFPTKRNILYATQSGPMLLVDGLMHPAFKKGSRNVNIRNGVGVLPDGRALLCVSAVPVSLWDFAAFFRRLGCKNALYLDGAISRIYFPEKGFTDTAGAFGVILGVAKK